MSPPKTHFFSILREFERNRAYYELFFLFLGRKYGWNATISRLLRPESPPRLSICH